MMTEKIRIMLIKAGNLPDAELARRIGTSPQNLSKKLKKDDFSESELRAIAKALECDIEINFVTKNGEKV